MKTRQGFVSNSSSSSFVVVGFLVRDDQFSPQEYLEKLYQVAIPEDPDDMDDTFNDMRYGSDFRIMDSEDGVPRGKSLVAYSVASWDDSGLEELKGLDLQDITTKVDLARDRLGLDAKSAPVKIWGGTSYC